jgi:hypothetical protein
MLGPHCFAAGYSSGDGWKPGCTVVSDVRQMPPARVANVHCTLVARRAP